MNHEALETLLRSARYNVEQIDADLANQRARHASTYGKAGIWTPDDMYHQGYQTGRKAELESLIATLEMVVA